MQWMLDRYNRLPDSRNMPMMIDRGPHDHLILQFDESLKMLCVYHNGVQLEMFVIHPLVFVHDFHRKDQRMLFGIKSQNDGEVQQKFRVKFSSMDAVGHFCATVSGYVTIKLYVEGSGRSRRPSSGASSVDLSMSNSNTSINPATYSQQSCSSFTDINRSRPAMADLSNSFSTQDSQLSSSYQNLKPIFHSHSTGDFGRQQSVGKEQIIMASQQPQMNNNPKVDVATQTSVVNNENVIVATANPVTLPSVHVHIENLLSVEAAKEFGKVLRHFVHCNVGHCSGGCVHQAKKMKDPNMPKKPITSFFLWCMENRSRVTEEIGSRKLKDVTRECAKQWAALSEEYKEGWRMRYLVDRVRYQQEMEDYKEGKRNNEKAGEAEEDDGGGIETIE